MNKESKQAWNLDLQYFPFVARSSHVFDHISVRMQLQWALPANTTCALAA